MFLEPLPLPRLRCFAVNFVGSGGDQRPPVATRAPRPSDTLCPARWSTGLHLSYDDPVRILTPEPVTWPCVLSRFSLFPSPCIDPGRVSPTDVAVTCDHHTSAGCCLLHAGTPVEKPRTMAGVGHGSRVVTPWDRRLHRDLVQLIRLGSKCGCAHEPSLNCWGAHKAG